MATIPYYLVNEAMNVHANEKTPEVGMLGTLYVGSDRYPYVVLKTYSPKRIVAIDINEDAPRVERGGVEYYDGDVRTIARQSLPSFERYFLSTSSLEEALEAFSRELGRFLKEHTYTLRKNGRWVVEGEGLWESSGLHLGKADYYLDPSF